MHGSASKPLAWARENARIGSACAPTLCYMAGRNKSGHDEAFGYRSRRIRNALRSLAGFPDAIAQELSRPLLNVTRWDVRVA